MTWKAKTLFEELKIERGVVKSWGNLGNATKEIVKYALRKKDLELAATNIREAHNYYLQNAEGGIAITRKDEISHGYWGLAEVYELMAENPPIRGSGFSNDRKVLLQKALWYAEEAHSIYSSLGGRKDINATDRLVKRLKQLLEVD
jgi:hypothetical protein